MTREVLLKEVIMVIKQGDMLWVKLKGPANDYGYGEVIEIYRNKKTIDSFYFYCLVNGGFRIGRVKNIIKNPTGRMVAKLAQSRREIQEELKQKR